MDVGIDLGTATVIVYIGGQGVVLSEPSVIAVNLKTDSVISVGQEAYDMVGKTPSHIQAIRPLSKGVVCDYKMTEEMVKFFIKKVCRDSLVKPRIALCVPSGITNVESNAVIDVAIASGARKVYLIEEPVAAAIGANIDIEKPNGNMIVDIGGGTTDIAVLSLGGKVKATSVRVAGNHYDDEILKHVRNKFSIAIGQRTAEQLKKNVACCPQKADFDETMEVKGRSLLTGLPIKVNVSTSDLYEPVMMLSEQIGTAAHQVLEKTPPELVADISNNGIVMTGGGSLVDGFDRLIEARTGIHTVVAEDAISCVAEGTGKSLDSLNSMTDGTVNLSRRRQMN